MKSLAIFLLAVVLTFPILRLLPIGTSTAPNKAGSDEVKMSRPRYIVPREIIFTGFPLPGGDFGWLSDPHFSFSKTAELETSDGKIFARAFSVNPSFTERLSEHLIVVIDSYSKENVEYNFPDADFSRLYHEDALFLVAENDRYIFLLASASLNDSDTFLIKLDRTTLEPPVIVVRKNTHVWSSLLLEIRSSVVLGGERFCASRWRPIVRFWKDDLGNPC